MAGRRRPRIAQKGSNIEVFSFDFFLELLQNLTPGKPDTYNRLNLTVVGVRDPKGLYNSLGAIFVQV